MSENPQQPAPNFPPFDPNAQHQQRPRLRPIRGFPVQVKDRDQPMLGLADARQISSKIVVTTPAAQAILPHMTGEHDIESIVSRVNESVQGQSNTRLERKTLEQFVAQLDDAALLEGPTFERLYEELKSDFDSKEILPPSTTAQIADALVQQEHGEGTTDEQKKAEGPEKLAKTMDEWIDKSLEKAQDPSFDRLPRAIIAPSIEFSRGWVNYATVYGRMRVVDKPDRVIVLGTNHFGSSSGVCGCDKGYETPLGVSSLDEGFRATLNDKLGAENAEKLYASRYDHEREHSIEHQIVWVQHVFGAGADGPKVWGALIHDPTRNAGESYDGKGLGMDPFVEALRQAIESSDGKTLVIASVDLSHIGPMFGDRQSVAGDEQTNEAGVRMRNRAVEHDRAMLQMLSEGKVDEMVASLAWQKNPTRWRGVGPLTAAARATLPGEVRMLNYMAAIDQQGMAMISSCSAAIF